MTIVQIICLIAAGLSGGGYAAFKLWPKGQPADKSHLYVFKPDLAHMEWLAKFKDALSTAPTEFQNEQILKGASISEALEAFAKRGTNV